VVAVSDRKEFRDLATPERAHEVVDGLDIDPGAETVPLDEARGRVLDERIDATLDVPGFDRASMDGYAVRAEDTFDADEASPVTLSLAGAVHAGERPAVSVEPGTAVEVSTGAVMPDGADAVVIVERTTTTDEGVEIRTAVTPGQNVMLSGADIAAGTRALGPGTRLTPREIGLLSALGVDEVPVRAKPTVGILSTGDELVRPGEPIQSQAGQIYDVNSNTIAAAVAEAGGAPELYPHVSDDYEAMERLLRRAATECDLVLSSGSTSASAVDVIYSVVEAQGTLLLHGTAIKPGKPMLVGELGDAAYVGLPGYPVSALTIFRTFVAPQIRDAAGLPEPATATVTGEMAVRERSEEGRRRLLAAGLVENGDGDLLVYPVDKGSGATTSLVDADGTVTVPADTAFLDAGETVTVELFSPDVRPPSVLCAGDSDPVVSQLLDGLDNPRFLPVGTHEALRRLRAGIPDVVVAAGPTGESADAVELGGWTREWGLVVPAGNPDGIEGVPSLIDGDGSMVNLATGFGLRTSFDAHLDALADEREVTRSELTADISGYDLTTSGNESPARAVAAGDADAGLGLRATATALELDFVSLGRQRVRVLTTPDRRDKPAVERLAGAIDAVDRSEFAGFD